MKRSALLSVLVPFLGAAILSGCSYLVDEDTSDCGGALRIDYRLRLVTNRLTELETVLPAEEDIPVAEALRSYLEPVFTDVAHDVDLSFYETVGSRLEHLNAIMDKDQFDCSLYLPAQTIRHACTANVADCGPVTLEEDAAWPTAWLHVNAENGQTEPQRTGLFTGRLTMEIPANADAHFNVDLYMVNAATALVLETKDAAGIGGIQAYVTGFADGFQLSDSTYRYSANPVVKADLLAVETGTQECYASVNFPSKDYRPGTRLIEETVEPFLSENAPDPLWEWRVYVQAADGTVTESVLAVMTPLRAGQLKILKAIVHDTGVVSAEDPNVGVSVTLDWNPGMDHNLEL